MSSARITKPDSRHSWRLGLAFLLLAQIWGFWPMIPLRRIAGLTTGYVYSGLLSVLGMRYPAVLLTLLVTCLAVFLVCRHRRVMLAVSLGSLMLLFLLDVYRVFTQKAHPDVLWPTLLWVFIALLLIVFRLNEGLRWYSVAIPAGLLVFWFYDSVIRLLGDLAILPDLGALWPRPDMSYTFGLDGLLGLPGMVYVSLPALLILAIIVSYREN